jgi:hypothetical protein
MQPQELEPLALPLFCQTSPRVYDAPRLATCGTKAKKISEWFDGFPLYALQAGPVGVSKIGFIPVLDSE